MPRIYVQNSLLQQNSLQNWIQKIIYMV